MADVSKFKSKGATRFGAPPPIDEASTNIFVPEVAAVQDAPKSEPVIQQATEPVKTAIQSGVRRRDGRALRRTGRVIPFSTRVSQDFDDLVRDIAEQNDLLIIEVLENAMEAYARELEAGKKS
ncbi:hypothetical protein [Extensimonas sp. H3M7-6]|uniref:hypothetical protein n=1 Tax=Extensimonas soli TaxID=3031322 RepID=UPI0023DCEA76|nr:hypothetical protein [Extensimonas sp. H3M7-6]MDF1482030.1 hypothetical protein [Extensimonas sp. H3M7-6]